MENEMFFSYLKDTGKKIIDFIEKNDLNKFLQPDDIYKGAYSYLKRPAKRLRPSVLLMACGCLGGEEREKLAVPAAAGIELFHTWTLVHDDILDNDKTRRGQPSVHELIRCHAKDKYSFSDDQALKYGRDIAILTGEIQHAWANVSFIDCALLSCVDYELILKIIRHLESYVIGNLICGQALDIRFGMNKDLDSLDIDEKQIIDMLWQKTGVLYEFAGLAGALIGKNTSDFDDKTVVAVKNFTGTCGTAFQFQDDILGIAGDSKKLGKPVGSDIKEGKKTVIVYHALKNASSVQKKKILSVLGNQDASDSDIEEVKTLFKELGGIKKAKEMALSYLEKAVSFLDIIEDSKYKRLLLAWADFMIKREF